MAEPAIRPYALVDEDEVLRLLAASLGRVVDDRYRALFRWKHLANPFGRSFMWVAESTDGLAGFRSFLRWRFVDRSGTPVEAVRAVDTATHPRHRGRGVFRQLTTHSLEEMRSAGTAFVFNTPNSQSLPGYLKMGWEVAGRVPMQIRPSGPLGMVRMARSRTAADPWPTPLDAGDDAAAMVWTGSPAQVHVNDQTLHTDRQADYLTWRYGAVPHGAWRLVPDERRAHAVVRTRRRGRSVECAIGDIFAPVGVASVTLREMLRTAGSDYAIAGREEGRLPGFLPSSRIGPLMTWRRLGWEGERPDLHLSMGDVETF